MRILFVSNDLIAGHLAYLLQREGHDVRLFIQEEGRRGNFDGLVSKSVNWKEDLSWVGTDGLIVFDDVGFGEEQDQLRARGYAVCGGSARGDQIEEDRVFGQAVFAEAGMQTLPSHTFPTIEGAIDFVSNHPGAWVVKQNGHASKGINYVGYFSDGRDVLDVLRAYAAEGICATEPITLQERADGEEIAVTRYFNGHDWIGMPLINIEHKRFFPGDIGPTTSEMGTLGWYEKSEDTPLAQATLAKLKPFLARAGYRGIIDINCIVNEKGIFPLEATSRPGSPIVHLQTELNRTPWSPILKAIATGESIPVDVRNDYGVVVTISIPPFPYAKEMPGHSQIGTQIHFSDAITNDDLSHIHFEEVSWDPKRGHRYISDNRGYVLYVTGHGPTVEDARAHAYRIIREIHIPKMMYRDDIGMRFVEKSRARLEAWGYLPRSTWRETLTHTLSPLTHRLGRYR